MKIESKRQRIDSDRGFLVLRPDEFAKLRAAALNESDGFDMAAAYSANKDRLAQKRAFVLKQLAAIEHFSLDDEVGVLGHMPEFGEQMGNAIGRMFGKSRITFVDWGSFKVAVVFNNGAALKVGVREGGLKDEIQNSLNFPELRCFPKLLGYDEKTWNSCLVEAVDPKFGDPECARFYGVARWKVVELLTGEPPVKDSEKAFLRNLESGKGAKWDSIRDLKKFFDEFRPLYDISYGNWGIAVRYGQEVPVVLDYDI